MVRPRADYERLNIYLDEPELRQKIKIAAAQRGVSASAYCLDAIRAKLATDGLAPGDDDRMKRRQEAARRLDAFRARIGPIGVPVSELVREGRRFTEET